MLRTVALPDWIAARGWVAPDYEGACFAGVPGTITQLLTGESLRAPLPASLTAALGARCERVVLVYFDALGFEIAERHAGHSLLARAAERGDLRPHHQPVPVDDDGAHADDPQRPTGGRALAL